MNEQQEQERNRRIASAAVAFWKIGRWMLPSLDEMLSACAQCLIGGYIDAMGTGEPETVRAEMRRFAARLNQLAEAETEEEMGRMAAMLADSLKTGRVQ